VVPITTQVVSQTISQLSINNQQGSQSQIYIPQASSKAIPLSTQTASSSASTIGTTVTYQTYKPSLNV